MKNPQCIKRKNYFKFFQVKFKTIIIINYQREREKIIKLNMNLIRAKRKAIEKSRHKLLQLNLKI